MLSTTQMEEMGITDGWYVLPSVGAINGKLAKRYDNLTSSCSHTRGSLWLRMNAPLEQQQQHGGGVVPCQTPSQMHWVVCGATHGQGAQAVPPHPLAHGVSPRALEVSSCHQSCSPSKTAAAPLMSLCSPVQTLCWKGGVCVTCLS